MLGGPRVALIQVIVTRRDCTEGSTTSDDGNTAPLSKSSGKWYGKEQQNLRYTTFPMQSIKKRFSELAAGSDEFELLSNAEVDEDVFASAGDGQAYGWKSETRGQ